MEAVDKVPALQLTAGETIEALGLFLAGLTIKGSVYHPKNYQVTIDRTENEVHFKVMVMNGSVYVGGLKITTNERGRKVGLTFNRAIRMNTRKRVDHVKTALRRLIITVAYHDYAAAKETKIFEELF